MLNFELPYEDLEYLINMLDWFPQDSRERAIRDELLLQAYE
jgi:hypothetical protein